LWKYLDMDINKTGFLNRALQSNSLMQKILVPLQGDGLKAKALRGSAWTFVGYGAAQLLRLISNLILTRILFPADFGVMALVSIVLQGVSLFSDMGIGPSIIQNKRGDDPVFLNTAWTIQVIRGILLCIAICILAWPVSIFYEQPILAQLLPVAALSSIISGFNPTKLFTVNRHLNLGRLTVVELISQVVSLALMIGLALWLQSVWALVAGGLISAILKLVLSNLILPGNRNSFAWDSGTAKELFSFGGWIFLSSCLGFFVSQGDRIVLGTFMSVEQLGVYSIASMLAVVVWQVNSKLSQSVLFPIYSRKKDASAEQLLPNIRQARILICAVLLLPACGLIAFGDLVIYSLYDERYTEAGWMLQVLVSGYAVLVATNIGPFYLAQGKSRLFFKLILVKSLILIIAMSVGGKLAGVAGIVVGVAAANLLYYPIQIGIYRHFGLWLWRLDLRFSCLIGLSGLVAMGRNIL
jgi:O-antigen/teichoic acid export membrane protein